MLLRRSPAPCIHLDDAPLSNLSSLGILLVTCSSPLTCDNPHRHADLRRAAWDTWLGDALDAGARVIVASDAPVEVPPVYHTAASVLSFPPPCLPSHSSLRDTYHRRRPREGIFRRESNRTLQALAHICDRLPDDASMRFWLKIDDDAYWRPHRLAPLLALLDHRQPLYVGSIRRYLGVLEALDGRPDIPLSRPLSYAMGGAGYLLSRGLLRRLCPQLARCRLFNGEDKTVGHCIHRVLRLSVLNVDGFHYGPPDSLPAQQRDAAYAFHRLEDGAAVRAVHRHFAARGACVHRDRGGDIVP